MPRYYLSRKKTTRRKPRRKTRKATYSLVPIRRRTTRRRYSRVRPLRRRYTRRRRGPSYYSPYYSQLLAASGGYAPSAARSVGFRRFMRLPYGRSTSVSLGGGLIAPRSNIPLLGGGALASRAPAWTVVSPMGKSANVPLIQSGVSPLSLSG
jgi:hypothetical protein